jgi:hypothetical protein
MMLCKSKPAVYSSLFAAFLLLFIGCRKAEMKSEFAKDNTAHENAVLSAAIYFDKNGKKITLITNAKGTSALCDREGNIIGPFSNPARENMLSMSGVTSCTDVDGDPIYSFDEVTFTGMSSFLCGINNGYKLQITFMIATELPLVSTLTKGQVRLRNVSKHDNLY